MKRLALALALLGAVAALCASGPSADDGGCTIDAPLSPAASHAIETQRARLGASDNGRNIVL